MVTTAITFESEKKRQRALVLQGGGALGAYEAGAFKALYEFISKKDDGKPFFDIVAGTSIGAINAAILVSHVIENNNNWKGSVEQLIGFWEYIASWDVSELPVFKAFERVPLPIVDILVWELQCGDTNHTNTTGVACLEYVYLMKLATA